jgi:tripartite ATP-independent transporter DctM subunit
MILLVAGYGVMVGVRSQAPRQDFHPGEALHALWDAKWDLGLPTLVVVAVATGFATVVEAAALGAAYSLVVELVVYRSIHPIRDLPRVLVHSSALVGSVLILLGSAYGLNGWFVDAEFPSRLVSWMTEHVHSPALFLLMLNAVLLVLGSVFEMYSAIVVIAPLVAPLGRAYGIEPVHLGVVFLANLELGFLFPPMGLNLFLSASRFGKPLPWVYRRSMPFLAIMTVGVLCITYLPVLTTGVVHFFTGH